MAGIVETEACLRFYGEGLDPDELTRLLGKEPSDSHRTGDQLRRRVAKTGAWFLEAPRRQPGDISSQISEMFEGTTEDLSVWTGLSHRFQGDVYCGFFMSERGESLILPVETLDALAKRGLRLQVEIYAPIEEDNPPGEETATPSPTGA